MNRRQFLRGTTGAGALALMPRLAMATTDDGIRELRAVSARQAIYEDALSDLWTYDGQAPGPEIRVRRGERVRIRLVNDLAEPTSIHWHGIRLANAMDGVAGLTQEAVAPGETFDYDFVAPDAGTYWYHSHQRSWEQVEHGLHGALVVEEDEPPFDRDHDLTLVIDDWRLDRSGRVDYSGLGSLMEWAHGGHLGNYLTVNGRSMPTYDLRAGEAYRLRLINAANARILALDPNRFDARVAAYDGQALPEPARPSPDGLFMGPAQRVDLIVTPKPGKSFALEEVSDAEPVVFATFQVSGDAEASAATPPALPVNSLPEPDLATARIVELDMTGGAMGMARTTTYEGKVLEGEDFRTTGQVWAFNGIANLAREPLLSVKRGETVVVETINNTAFPHAMHVHGHHFRIVERTDSGLDDTGTWRDTFLIGRGEKTRIAFVADNPGKWLLHCHMLEHAATGMNTWFEVV